MSRPDITKDIIWDLFYCQDKTTNQISKILDCNYKIISTKIKQYGLPSLRPRTHNLVGSKYGRLTVLREIKKGKKGIHYECICDCGKKYEITSHGLKHGTKSCCCDASSIIVQYPITFPVKF